jgi:hypothetical protein
MPCLILLQARPYATKVAGVLPMEQGDHGKIALKLL